MTCTTLEDVFLQINERDLARLRQIQSGTSLALTSDGDPAPASPAPASPAPASPAPSAVSRSVASPTPPASSAPPSSAGDDSFETAEEASEMIEARCSRDGAEA